MQSPGPLANGPGARRGASGARRAKLSAIRGQTAAHARAMATLSYAMDSSDSPSPADPPEDSDDQRVPDDRAADALRRAAELQLEAAERAGQALARVGSAGTPGGYERRELVAAAREAGIDEQFVRVALAEIDSEERALVPFDESKDRAVTRWLGTRRRSVSVSRIIQAPVDETWKALVEAAESDDWRLRLRGSSGGHPTAGGVATFNMVRLAQMVKQRGSYNQLCVRMEQLEAWSVQATLSAYGDRTDVTLYLDLRPGALTNLKWAKISTWIGAAGGGGGALAAGLSAGAVAAGAFAALAGLGVAGLSVALWRVSYRHAADRLVALFDELLADVQISTERRALVGDVE